MSVKFTGNSDRVAPARIRRHGAYISLAVLSVAIFTSARAPAQAGSGRSIHLDYALAVHDIPASATSVIAWVPLARNSALQRVERTVLPAATSSTVVSDPEYGNKFLMVDLSREPRTDGRTSTMTLSYDLVRKALRPGEKAAYADEVPAPISRFLSADRFVPLTGKIREEASAVTRDLGSPIDKSRALYDQIVDTVKYDKSGVGWGRGDASYACDVRKGNCTDFHSLFIAEARVVNLPARFIMGIPLPPDQRQGNIKGYHCWAEFYLEGKGWFPVDASEAHKNPERRSDFFMGLDEHRVEFSVGRDIHLPGMKGEPLNYIIEPYVEIDGQPFSNVDYVISFHDLPGTPGEMARTVPAE